MGMGCSGVVECSRWCDGCAALGVSDVGLIWWWAMSSGP